MRSLDVRVSRILLVVLLCSSLCPAAASADQYGVSFLSSGTPPTLATGESYAVALTVRNTGTLTWKRAQLFRLAYHWVDSKGIVVVRDGVRTELPHNVAPGETIQLCATLVAPDATGPFELRWDMVHEQRTWFSEQDPKNVLTSPVTILRPTSHSPDRRAVVIVGLFWLLTLGPLLLTAYWVYARWRQEIASLDEYLFHTVVFGIGHVYLVLHVLVFTVGMTLTTVGLTLVVVHLAAAAMHWWIRAHQNVASRTPSRPSWAKRPVILELVGASVILSLLIQWAWVSSRGMEIVGTDAANYHVPHALNFLRGVNPFDFLATPHIYPMGTSVWAAWFFQPFNDPLLLELATAPAFLLLFGAACLLFRLLTNRSGIAWAPWILLLAFTGYLPRLSMLMSADLAYSAAFVALVAQLLLIWQTRAFGIRHLLATALCAGLLVSSKSTGLFSLAYIGFFGALTIVLLRRRGHPIQGTRPLPVAAAMVCFLASGGIWIVRNWWLYGSPVAPYGLSAFGMEIFPGQPASSTRYYLSVLGDLQRQPNYPVWNRFSESAREMFGAWIVPLALLALLLFVDLVLQFARHRTLNRAARAKLLLAGWLVTGFAVHAVVIAGLPWTSLNWTKGLSVRYLLPFFFLYTLVLYSFAFVDGIAWRGARTFRAIGATALISGALWYYHAHQATPALPEDRWIAALRPEALVVSAALVVSGFLATIGRARTLNTGVAVAIAAALLVGLSWQGVLDHDRNVRTLTRTSYQESSCALAGAAPSSEHRGLYLRVVAFQQSKGASCAQTRFFIASRFDAPIELQNTGYRNLVLDAGSSSHAALARSGPRTGGCDIIVVAKADVAARETRWLGSVLQTRGALKQVAEYGRYEAYVAQ